MDTVLFSVRAILPMLVTIGIGMLFAFVSKWDKRFFRQLNALVFRLLMPLNLFNNILSISHADALNWRALVFLLGSSLLWILVGFFAAYAFRVEPRKKAPSFRRPSAPTWR